MQGDNRIDCVTCSRKIDIIIGQVTIATPAT
jgi:hypothetical protein